MEKKRNPAKWLRRCLGVAALSWLAVIVAGCVSQRAIVWPMSVEEEVDRPVPPGARPVWVSTEDGDRVEGWFFPGLGRGISSPGPALVFFHGNNELMDHCLEYPETYVPWGLSVLLVDYRGYGRSGGKPSREGIRADAIQFIDWLRAQPEVDPHRIVYQGRSIGGAVAADLAEHRKPAAMVLAATFASMEAMYWRYFVPGFLAADKYRTVDVLEQADFPVLVMHGKRDNIIPVSSGRKLGRTGALTRYIEYDANHDLPTDWEQFEADIRGFLADSGILVEIRLAP